MKRAAFWGAVALVSIASNRLFSAAAKRFPNGPVAALDAQLKG